MAKRRVEQQSGKQDQTGVAIGFEQRKAEIGIGDIEPDDLPGQVRGEGEKAKAEDRAAARGDTCRTDENDG